MARYIDISPYEDCKIVLHNEDTGVSIKDIPSADVKKVEYTKFAYMYRIKKIVCINCGFEEKNKSFFKYCPNCGAKIESEE